VVLSIVCTFLSGRRGGPDGNAGQELPDEAWLTPEEDDIFHPEPSYTLLNAHTVVDKKAVVEK